MTVMTEPIGLAEGRPFTVHDLETMPDDGRRYEIIDGMLLVTPAPGWSHQEMSGALYVVLHAACPSPLRVLLAPFAVRTAPTSEVQPDVLVARRAPAVPGRDPPGPAPRWPAPAVMLAAPFAS